MNIRNFTMLIASALLLCSCANPYYSLYSESSSKIKTDIRFLESYKKSICGIKEKHETKEISSGTCLALYYDYKDQPHIEDERKDVVKRLRYILKNPDKFDQNTFDPLSQATVEIANCNDYINMRCI